MDLFGIGAAIDKAVAFVVGWLREMIFGLIGFLYQLVAIFYNAFLYLTKAQLLGGDNENLVNEIYGRVQVVLAVIMVFYVTLEFIKYIVNPDTFSDKEKGGGSLVKRVLVVIVLMAFTPQIFGWARVLQDRIIATEVIPKVLIKNYDATDFGEDAGGQFASNFLALFYKPYVTSSGTYPSGKCSDGRTAQRVVDDNLDYLADNGKMLTASYCIGKTGGDVVDNGVNVTAPFLIMNGWFEWIAAIVVAGFMIYVLASYCVEAGRVIIQFLFLQVIAPIPIISYLAPGKDGMFQKWTRQCVTTYIDLFIRLFIMYLILMLAQIILEYFGNGVELFPGFSSLDWYMKAIIIISLIIGLLLFALKAPKMVKELLPGGGNAASGDFGFGAKSAKERFSSAGRVAGAAGGAVAGGLYGAGHRAVQGARSFKNIKDSKHKGLATARAIGNTVKGLGVGAVAGTARGAWHGGKSGNMLKNISTGVKGQRDSNVRFGNIAENQYGVLKRTEDRVRNVLNLDSRVEVKEKTKTKIEERSKQLTTIQTLNKEMRTRAEDKLKENGNAAILGAEKRLRDLKEDPATLAQYTASKYATQADADRAYVEAQQLAADRVNKQNYYDAVSGTFDQAAYDAACNRAKNTVDRTQYVATRYRTEADAKAALDAALAAAQKDLKDTMDREVNAYIDNAIRDPNGDGRIKNLRNEHRASVEAYNATAANDRKINPDDYMGLDAEQFDKYVKGDAVSGQISKDTMEVSRLTGEQQVIKNEVQGSGVAGEGGKK